MLYELYGLASGRFLFPLFGVKVTVLDVDDCLDVELFSLVLLVIVV